MKLFFYFDTGMIYSKDEIYSSFFLYNEDSRFKNDFEGWLDFYLSLGVQRQGGFILIDSPYVKKPF